MNAVVEDYVDGIGAYVRGVHSEIASCLNMSPEQLDIVALNNMVQTQKKTQRVLVTTLDPKSTEPIRARSERHTLYGMIRTLRDINSLARLPQADILNAANTASYMDNELTGPYARKISVPIPLHLPIVVESKRRPRTIGSASSTASVYSLNDPPTSAIANLGFDLPVSLKIRASMCSYAEQQENQNQQKKNNNNNNLSRPTTLPPPSPPPPLDDDNGDDDGDELMQVCGVRGASGRNSLYDENGCRLAGLTPFPLLMCDDTRFRNIVKPAGVIRPIEAIAHNLRSSSIKFSTIGLSGGSSSSSSQAATWLNNYVKNRKSSFGTREIPTVVAALCKDATALCSNVYIELGRMFSWMCDRKIISPSQSQTFSSAAYACRVTNTSGGGGGGGGGAPGGNILTRACKNNPDRLEILNVVFGAAELYGGMNYNLTETIDREYERDADMSTVMVGASLRLYVGTSARRLGRSVTGKTTTMTAASGDPAGGGGGGRRGSPHQHVVGAHSYCDTSTQYKCADCACNDITSATASAGNDVEEDGDDVVFLKPPWRNPIHNDTCIGHAFDTLVPRRRRVVSQQQQQKQNSGTSRRGDGDDGGGGERRRRRQKGGQRQKEQESMKILSLNERVENVGLDMCRGCRAALLCHHMLEEGTRNVNSTYKIRGVHILLKLQSWIRREGLISRS